MAITRKSGKELYYQGPPRQTKLSSNPTKADRHTRHKILSSNATPSSSPPSPISLTLPLPSSPCTVVRLTQAPPCTDGIPTPGPIPKMCAPHNLHFSAPVSLFCQHNVSPTRRRASYIDMREMVRFYSLRLHESFYDLSSTPRAFRGLQKCHVQ